MSRRAEDIPVVVVSDRRAVEGHPSLPRLHWVFALWMGVGAGVAAGAGLLLGVLAAAEASIGGVRWTETVQAHGRVQLFVFVAPFAVALAMEFLPRLNQQRPLSHWLRLGIPGVLLIGALAMGASQVWEDQLGRAGLPGAITFACGAAGFAWVAVTFPSPRGVGFDPQPLYFKAAGLWLAVSGLLATWGFAEAEEAVVPLDLSAAVSETFLRGFVMLLIAGVALRAFPGHLDLRPMRSRGQAFAFGGFNVSMVLWIASAGLGGLDEFETGRRISDGVFAATLAAFLLGLGVFRGLGTRPGGPRYGVLIPIACLGALAHAVMLGTAAMGWPGLGLYQSGAIRHTFMLGFMAPLMVAMSHIVLARFGTGQIPWENALTAGFILLVAAWPLRVGPVVFSEAPSEAGQAAMSVAGGLGMAGMGLVAAVCLRTAFEVRRATRNG